MTKLDKLYEISKRIVQAMDETFENDSVISCKEMALLCLEASCPSQYQPEEFKKAIQIIKEI